MTTPPHLAEIFPLAKAQSQTDSGTSLYQMAYVVG